MDEVIITYQCSCCGDVVQEHADPDVEHGMCEECSGDQQSWVMPYGC